MSIITSPEMFINMKRIPDKNSAEYEAFFEAEREKIENGVTINGFHIGGWLYWHLNQWNIETWVLPDPTKPPRRKVQLAGLRDNELYYDEMYHRAERERKGLMLFGTRRFGKSEIIASHIGRCATIYENSQNIIAGGFDGDIQIITSKVDLGLGLVHDYFRMTRIKSNWNKQVDLGFKNKQNKNFKWSEILIRNFEEGTNPKVLEGITPTSLVIDEVGKYRFVEAFQAAIPSFNTAYGWSCVPILTGTGGQFIPNSDAEKLFDKPHTQNFLAVHFPGYKKPKGVFISGTYRMDAKEKTILGDYIQRTSGIYIPADSELNTIPFEESNPEKAIELINNEIDQFKQSDEPRLALKQKMYFPLKPEDCFLNEDINNFPLEAIKQQIEYLQEKIANGTYGQYVKFYRDLNTGKVKKSFDTKLLPIFDFPANKNSFKDACIVMYEDRMSELPPYGLYIAGVDPYNQNESVNSSSLGTCYIYKRFYDPLGGTFQDMIVASYAARPSLMKEWYDNVEMLLEYYNAICMAENEGYFVQWFDQKNKAHMLADGFSALKEISPSTSIKGRIKGLPATSAVKSYYLNLNEQYAKEPILLAIHPETKEEITKLGVARVPDIVLLKEWLAFSKDGNFDRHVAFGMVRAYDTFLKKYSPVVDVQEPEPETQPTNFRPKSPFLKPIRSPFISK